MLGVFRPKTSKRIKPLGKYPFCTVFQSFLAYQEIRIAESSYVDIKDNYERHHSKFFSEFDVTEILPKTIIEWQSEMNAKSCKDKPLSFKYKQKALSHLRTFFNYCIEIERIITENPVTRKLKFIDNEPEKEMLIYSPEEYSKFRAAIDKSQDIVLFDMLYFTGMRKGELLALKWSDWKSDTISITKTYVRKTKDGKWKLTKTKSGKSRNILLTDKLINQLTNLKTTKEAKDEDFIFGDSFPSNERYLDNARDKYYNKAEVKRIRIHDFRHSHVSYLINCNVDVMTIAHRIGDKIETILDTYAHLMPNKQQEMIGKLNDFAVSVTKM